MSLEPDGQHHFPMTGIEIWKNPKNRFCIFQCHYTADEDKRSEAFRLDKEHSLPRRKYLMEYEIHWESFSGLPVYGDTWSDKAHLNKQEMYPELGLPLLLGFDWGLTPACVVCQLSGRRLRIFKEYVAVNMGAERFIALVIKELALLYPGWRDLKKDIACFIDPAGTFRKDTDEGTCAKILDARGFGKVISGAIGFQERRASVEYFLTTMDQGLPAMEVSAMGCPMLVKGFQGGYSFKEGQDELESAKLEALKNEYSHPHDALQYLTSRVLRIRPSSKVNIPSPSYSWTQ